MLPSRYRRARQVGGAALLLLATLAGGSLPARAQQSTGADAPGAAPVAPPTASAGAATSAPAEADALVRRGEYLTRAADCMPCHTRPGGTPFAGGLVMNTPFGQIASPNITPDRRTGIGRWTERDFWNVLHNGVGPHLGDYIYPVMTYTSYTKLTRADVDAIWAYMRTIGPVDAPRLPVSLPFPFNVRPVLIGWRLLFFHPGVYRPDPTRSAVWNRGAYLVEGAGHCGECHSPRDALGGIVASRSLAGGLVDGYLAPNISSDPRYGIGAWSADQIVAFLKGGDNVHNVVFGPMTEVVHDSMAFMTDADLHAIATYLATTPPRADRSARAVPDRGLAVARGKTIYEANCAQCHQANGGGVAGAIPSLAANGVVGQRSAADIIMPVLVGQAGQGHYGAMPAFGGALDDQAIADVANYVRTSFGNAESASVTASAVRAERVSAPTGLGGSFAARRLGCAPIGDGTVPGTVATEGDVAVAAWIDQGHEADAVSVLAGRARDADPDATPADVMRLLSAAYCPVVASAPGLDDAARRARLRTFAGRAGILVAQQFPPAGAEVVLTTTVTPATATAVSNAAASAHMPVPAFVAKQLGNAAKTQ